MRHRSTVTHVEVVQTKLLQGIVQRGLNLLGLVAVVPQLGGDEDVLALQAGDLGEGLLDALADLALVLVDLGQVQVAVAGLEGLVDAGADLAGADCQVPYPSRGNVAPELSLTVRPRDMAA